MNKIMVKLDMKNESYLMDGERMPLEIGDLVKWVTLDISIVDYNRVVKPFLVGDIIKDIPVSHNTRISIHTGFVTILQEDYVVIMDMIGREEKVFQRYDAMELLFILNKASSSHPKVF